MRWIKSVWGSVTGKKKAEKAKAKLEALQEKFEKRDAKYQSVVEQQTNSIVRELEAINKLKESTYTNAFPEFLKIANRLHNISIAGAPLLEAIQLPENLVHKPIAVRSKSEILTIDFDNLSAGDIAKGIITFGCSSRKAAKESLKRAEDEEQRMEEEFAKMDASENKLERTLNSISEVHRYFKATLDFYQKIGKRLQHGIAAQQVAHIAFNGAYAGKVDFRSLPIKQLEDFMALYNMTILLKEMATRNYLTAPTEGNPELSIDEKDQQLLELTKNNAQQLGIAA